ncbi:MAG: hypothetical protein ABID09_00355 [Candidatus Omnitrophota bacterium]
MAKDNFYLSDYYQRPSSKLALFPVSPIANHGGRRLVKGTLRQWMASAGQIVIAIVLFYSSMRNAVQLPELSTQTDCELRELNYYLRYSS